MKKQIPSNEGYFNVSTPDKVAETKKMNDLHERALRLIHCDHSSSFQELLQRDNSMTIHRKKYPGTSYNDV